MKDNLDFIDFIETYNKLSSYNLEIANASVTHLAREKLFKCKYYIVIASFLPTKENFPIGHHVFIGSSYSDTQVYQP